MGVLVLFMIEANLRVRDGKEMLCGMGCKNAEEKSHLSQQNGATVAILASLGGETAMVYIPTSLF